MMVLVVGVEVWEVWWWSFGKVGGFWSIVKSGATIILSHHDRKEEGVWEMFF